MSKVIKNSEMLLTLPIVIESFEFIKTEDEAEKEAILDNDSNHINPLELEKQELEGIKLESQNILTETEQMVMELLQKARNEARDIITNAREEAEVVKTQAGEEAVSIRQKAHQEAYEKGLRQAQQEIEGDRQAAIQQSQALLEEARQSKLKVFRSCEGDIVRLVMAMVKKVIAGELNTNPDIIINILQEAIDFLDRPENITVYVNPQEVENILEVMDKGYLTDIGTNHINMNIKADERVSRGGCLLESDAGSVDAQLETRIASVNNAIQEVVADDY
ncbi:MAG: FliH/SctL family protein [Syntrophomonadaceae bacterium]|nr:FliH/SctL family protein [Syntrophomonadaceae bacterium]MDD3899578.1 FliH/SctL family protein [Syntrophomonadaceae bacterium]MDD4561856.1 FliH/SctL family protein [Syntrophomonadaceae bacterium]